MTTVSPLTPRQEHELRSAQQQLIRQLDAAGRPELVDKLGSSLFPLTVGDVRGVDQALARRVGVLNDIVERSGGCRCAVIAVPPDAARYHSFSSWKHPHARSPG